MFGKLRKQRSAAREKATDAAQGVSLPFELSLSDFIHRLPSADDARGSLVSTAQRALHAMPDVNLPGRKPRGRKRKKLVLAAGFIGLAGGAFLVYRRFIRRGADEEEWSSDSVNAEWPSTPSTGDKQQAPESDAEAGLDAEQSAAVLSQAGAPAGASASGNGAQARP